MDVIVPADRAVPVFLCIIERNRQQEFLAILVLVIGNILSRDPVAECQTPVDIVDHLLYFIGIVSQGQEAAHQAAHAGTDNQIDRHADFFQVADDAYVTGAFRAAATQDQGHCGTMFPDFGHLRPHLAEGQRIGFRVDPEPYRRRLGRHRREQQHHREKEGQ